MISDAVAAVAKNLRRTSTVQGVSRVDSLEIPEEVLREAIANAVIHREYGDRFCGQSIAVDVFDDRIEVTNPGGYTEERLARTCLTAALDVAMRRL